MHDNTIGGVNLSSDNFSHDYYYDAIEAMGTDIQVYNNFISGGWTQTAMVTFTTDAWGFWGNTMVGCRREIVADGPSDKYVPPAPANYHDNHMYASGAMATPPPPASTLPVPGSGSAGAAAAADYNAVLYSNAPQPFITEVYANNVQPTAAGYIAIELHNPYDKDISLMNWQLATLPRRRRLPSPPAGHRPFQPP